MASVRRRLLADGSWSYEVRGPGVTVRAFKSGTDAQRRKDAETYRVEAERRLRLGDMYVEAPELFGVALDRYLAVGRARWREKTVDTRMYAAVYLEPLRRLPLPGVRRTDVERIVAACAAATPRMAQQVLALAKAVLRDAEGNRQRVDRAVYTIKQPRYEPRPSTAISYEDAWEVAGYLDEPYRRYIPLMLLLGLRRVELLHAREAQVDLRAATFAVLDGKTANARRTIHMPAEAVKLVREQLAARYPTRSGWLFPAVDGSRMSDSVFGHMYGQARQLAGYPTLRIHDLRHSAVTLYAQAGGTFDLARARFGWSPGTASEMWERYRHVFSAELAAEAQRLDRYLNPKTDSKEGTA